MQTQTKTTRIAAIEALPNEMQDFALIDWPTVAVLANLKDSEYAKELVVAAGVPLVHLSERRKLPTWGAIRKFLQARTVRAA